MKSSDDGEVDVGVEQGLANFLQAVADVGFGEPATPAELLERVAQTALDAFEHRFTSHNITGSTADRAPCAQPGVKRQIIGESGTGCNGSRCEKARFLPGLGPFRLSFTRSFD